jgi:deoxyribodipyrimidine photo-lyase
LKAGVDAAAAESDPQRIYAHLRPRPRGSGVRPDRVFSLREAEVRKGPVVYWMSRDQRVSDNWALLLAQEKAIQLKVPLVVVFCLVPRFLGAAWRQYAFMIRGLREVEEKLEGLGIPFRMLTGSPGEEIPRFLRSLKAGFLISDFDPLRIKRSWQEEVLQEAEVPFLLVDNRNIIPCRVVSQKQEYAAHTLRRKVRRLLGDYLEACPQIRRHPYRLPEEKALKAGSWAAQESTLQVTRDIKLVPDVPSGESAASGVLHRFLQRGIRRYADDRNDPNASVQSGLSPYLHFGQISSLRIAREVLQSDVPMASKEAFLEELVTRRELADNFCYYQPYYEGADGFPEWARKTLEEHRKDRRDPVYPFETFEAGRTHDPLWNAAQREMVMRGNMPGYLRMYWAKKILEWSPSPEEAMSTAVTLNDRYQLDGRDPNGYAGIAWSIGGVHDRPWFERPIFGKIRYMSQGGCRSKFDVDAYIARVRALEASPASEAAPASEAPG